MSHGITSENIHYWKNAQGRIMVSDEDNKKLWSFEEIDDAINGLYILGFRESAREINASK